MAGVEAKDSKHKRGGQMGVKRGPYKPYKAAKLALPAPLVKGEEPVLETAAHNVEKNKLITEIKVCPRCVCACMCEQGSLLNPHSFQNAHRN